jgi:radical SAM superfamily enzyme YgiQ (UPF0313 family)
VRIYLVNPGLGTSFWSLSEASDITGKRGYIPNLAPPTLAALTPPDIEVVICDETVEAVDLDMPCDLVGITGYVSQSRRMVDLARMFRERGRLVAIGGPFASLSPERCRPYADILFTGEAELTWPAFLEDFRAGRHRDHYDQSEKIDFALSPPPRVDLLRNERYAIGVIQTSRGCPFECEFCDVIVYLGRRIRHKAVAQILSEADTLYGLGYRSIFLSDDNFTVNRKKATEILTALREWNRARAEAVIFSTQLSIDIVRDPDVVDLCAAAGLNVAFVGIETPNKSALEEAKKRQNVGRDLEASIRELQARGVCVQAGMIVGFDHDTTDVFRQQFEFLQRANVPICSPGMLNAPARTPLEQRLRADGRLVDRPDFDHYSGTNIVPKQMSVDELRHGTRWLLNRLYDPVHFQERLLGLCETWPDSGPVNLGIGVEEGAEYYTRLLRAFSTMGPEFRRIPLRTLRHWQRKPSGLNTVFSALVTYKHIVSVMRKLDMWDPTLGAAPSPWVAERSLPDAARESGAGA